MQESNNKQTEGTSCTSIVETKLGFLVATQPSYPVPSMQTHRNQAQTGRGTVCTAIKVCIKAKQNEIGRGKPKLCGFNLLPSSLFGDIADVHCNYFPRSN